MTPKEKAEDLLYQMRYNHMSGTLTKKKAKRCASTAVDEIIEALENNAANSASWLYYEEVKKEIEKL
jgi:hypothetical protein